MALLLSLCVAAVCQSAPASRPELARTLHLDRVYLHLPVRTGAPRRRLTLQVGGQVVRECEIELSAQPGWYAHLDVSAWRGQDATLRLDGPAEGDALARVVTADQLWDVATLHREPLRPQLHWSPPRGWTNDPNGLLWHAGEFHLFYQHNPYGWAWGNMHWGHAVSRDLVHWQDLPIALYPRGLGDLVFSGSAVVDGANTAGWKTGAEDVLVAAFTSTGRGECLARSTDRGRTWSECDGNPVVRHQGRDPRLLWHAPTRRWVMAVYDEHEGKRWIAFHTSPDLRHWTFQSRSEGFFECPDLFALPLDGDPGRMLWVLTAASSEYRVGSFDGAAFTPQTPMLPGHRGRGFYAAQTFSNLPDGRVVQLGWLQAETPGMPFNQAMSLPLQLTLRGTEAGPRLCWQPVAELAVLRQGAPRVLAATLTGDTPLALEVGEQLEAEVALTPDQSRECGVDLGGVRIAWDAGRGELVVAGQRVAVPLDGGAVRLRAFTDRTAVEVFAAGGLVYVPVALPPGTPRHRSVRGFATGGIARLSLTVHSLKSIW